MGDLAIILNVKPLVQFFGRLCLPIGDFKPCPLSASHSELSTIFAYKPPTPLSWLCRVPTRSAMTRPTPGTLNSSFWCCRHLCDCCTCCSISASNSCSCSLSHSMCRSTLDCFCSRFETFGGLTAFEELEFASVLDRATQTAEYLILSAELLPRS